MEFHHVIAWLLFLAVVLALLAIDLLVLHRKPHAIALKEAAIGAAVPVAAALLFIVAIYFAYENHWLDLGMPSALASASTAKLFPATGIEASRLFLTGYLVELSLSADNVFLFVILMSFFKVPREYQHRVLFWGVLGALVMRGVMIVMGAVLLARLEWIIYIFGAFLIFTGVKFLFASEPKDPSDNIAVRLSRKFLPFKDGFDGKRFFTRVDGKRVATTLFMVLVCIEFTDLVFALDSIPAIFGITRDPFIVFTSNVFAILGLRSMYFLLAGVMDRFHLLRYGLAVVLGFVGIKMLVPGIGELFAHFTGRPQHWDIDAATLPVVVALALSIVASLMFPSKTHHANPLESSPSPSPSPSHDAQKTMPDHDGNGRMHDSTLPKPTPHLEAPR